MMNKSLSSLLAALMLVGSLALTGCFTHTHVVGDGAQTGVEVSERQWYVLWGLVPIAGDDSTALAEGAEDYTITSEFTFVDLVIGVFTGIITVQPRTVTVTK